MENRLDARLGSSTSHPQQQWVVVVMMGLVWMVENVAILHYYHYYCTLFERVEWMDAEQVLLPGCSYPDSPSHPSPCT